MEYIRFELGSISKDWILGFKNKESFVNFENHTITTDKKKLGELYDLVNPKKSKPIPPEELDGE